MKTITHEKGMLRVETPLGIVDIRVGIVNSREQRFEIVDVIPNDLESKVEGTRKTYLSEKVTL